MAFTNEQLERYSRHIILKEIGAKGQKKQLNAKVLIIGAGGLEGMESPGHLGCTGTGQLAGGVPAPAPGPDRGGQNRSDL